MNTEQEPKAPDEEESPALIPQSEPEDKPSQVASLPLPDKKTRPVIFYIVLMFGVALFLIILSFFMQQRNHEALLKGLSSSAASVQSIVDLEIEKKDLEEQVSALQTELSSLKTQQEAQAAELLAGKDGLRAMEYLGEARLAQASGKHKEAKRLLALLQEGELYTRLPESSASEGNPSPKQQYLDLVNALS